MANFYLSPISAVPQYLTDVGVTLGGGKIWTYGAGTTAQAPTYTDDTGVVVNANPIVLDANGRLPNVAIWQAEGVFIKYVFTDANNNPIGNPIDQVEGINDPTGLGAFVTEADVNEIVNAAIAAGVQPIINATIASTVNQAFITAALYPQTAAEIAVSVVPKNTLYPQGNVLRYGADPTAATDSSAAFIAALSVTGKITAVGNFLINSALTLDISTTTLVGPSILASGLTATAGPLLTVIASSVPETNAKNTISQISFNGAALTGVQAVSFTDAIGTGVCNFVVSSCVFTGFADGVVIGNNAFEIEFHGCSFSLSGGDHAALYAHGSSVERVSCVQCEFFNNTECIRVDGGGEVFLDNCSLDYSNRLINAIFGDIMATNCYFENGSTMGDLDFWFQTGANDSTIVLSGGKIAQTITKTAFAIGNSAAVYGGGIFFRNVKLFSNTNGVINPLIAGTGNAFGSGIMIDGFQNSQVAWSNFSATQNFCSNGTFSNSFNGWTVKSSDTSVPTVTANTMSFKVDIGGQSLATYWTINAAPGENVGFTLQMMGNTASCQYGMVIRAMGGDGSVLQTSPLLDTFNAFNGVQSPCPTTFTTVRATMLNLPPGTATCQFEMNTLGATSNANIISMQSVLIGKY